MKSKKGDLMKIEFDMPQGLEEQLKSIVITATEDAIKNYYEKLSLKEWFSISEAAQYLGVSINTFGKLRVMGLPVCEIDGIRRVNRNDIDVFMKKHSY